MPFRKSSFSFNNCSNKNQFQYKNYKSSFSKLDFNSVVQILTYVTVPVDNIPSLNLPVILHTPNTPRYLDLWNTLLFGSVSFYFLFFSVYSLAVAGRLAYYVITSERLFVAYGFTHGLFKQWRRKL